MTDKVITAKSKADQMIKRLAGGGEVYNLMKGEFESNFLINGQAISVWIEKFRVTLPMDNLTPGIIQELSMKVMELHQEATFHHAAAQSVSQFIKRGSQLSYYHRFNELTEEYKKKQMKLPAAATLEVMAKAGTEDEESAEFRAELAARFWKLILEHLSTCRKILETASFSVNNELKLEHQNSMAERAGRGRDQ